MDSFIMNLSSCDSGRGYVPAISTGFWVPMTIKGSGTAMSIPSIVTLCSSMTSRRADWVLGEVLLSSSARTILFATGPGIT